MKTLDLINSLHAIAKKGVIANHQEREAIRAAALNLAAQDKKIHDLEAKIDAMNQISMEAVTQGPVTDDFWADDNCE